METKKIIMIFACSIFSSIVHSQELNYNRVKSDLTEYLIQKKEISEHNAEDYRKGKWQLDFEGVLNFKKDKLIDGLYLFTTNSSHSFLHYILVENNNYQIFDLRSTTDLNDALKKMLEFCERKKICSEIVIQYTDRLVGAYLNINKNPRAGHDVNCENGINDKSTLP